MSGEQLRNNLRQMIALLQAERQALADFDINGIMGGAPHEVPQCGTRDAFGPFVADPALNEECQSLLDAARRLNEANRQIRNLIAADVADRLDALGRHGTMSGSASINGNLPSKAN